jgi:hypothetical protein
MFPLRIGDVLNQDNNRRENAKTMFNGVSEVIQEEGILCKKSRESNVDDIKFIVETCIWKTNIC